MSKPNKNDDSKSQPDVLSTSGHARRGESGPEFGEQRRLPVDGEDVLAPIAPPTQEEHKAWVERIRSWFFGVERAGSASLNEVCAAVCVDEVEAQRCLASLVKTGFLEVEVGDLLRYRITAAGSERFAEDRVQLGVGSAPSEAVPHGRPGGAPVATPEDQSVHQAQGRSQGALQRLDVASAEASAAAWRRITGSEQPSRGDVQSWLDALYEEVHQVGDSQGHLGSHEANARLATQLRLVLQWLGGYTLRDPKSGLIGQLYHTKARRSPWGRFVFKVRGPDGKQSDGWVSVRLPRLELAP